MHCAGVDKHAGARQAIVSVRSAAILAKSRSRHLTVSTIFVVLFLIASVFILVTMLLHTAVFGTVLYTVLRRLRQSAAESRPLACAH